MLLIRTVSFLEWNGSEILYFSYQFEYGLNTVFAAISYLVLCLGKQLAPVCTACVQSKYIRVLPVDSGGESFLILSWLFFMLPRFSHDIRN